MADNTTIGASSNRKRILGFMADGRLDAECTRSAWTEEMHSSFLNRMEAAFVHDILFCWPPACHHHATVSHRRFLTTAPTAEAATLPCRLERYVPDSAESTRMRRPGRNDGIPGAETDISTLSDGAKDDTITNHHTLSGPRNDIVDQADQVVPLFQTQQTRGNCKGAGHHQKRRRYFK